MDNISFYIGQGVICGLLGPNGAGKSTLLRIIMQIIRPTSGKIFFYENQIQPSHLMKIGYLPEERGLYKRMKVSEHILYLSLIKGLSYKRAKQETDYWLNEFDILHLKYKKIEQLSKGVQQKIQLIISLINNPELLILDEPFSGLDPISSTALSDKLLKINKAGTTILLSTHDMESVETLCSQILLIDKGRFCYLGIKVRLLIDMIERYLKFLFPKEREYLVR